MPKVKLPETTPDVKLYKPSKMTQEVSEFLAARVDELKDFRKQPLAGNARSIETIWDEAEREYQPHELEFAKRKRLESDEETGLRSRLVEVGREGDWQSNASSPDFYVKVNTALSILIDQNPEAVFVPAGKRYEKNSKVAYNNWKNSWEVSGAKQQLKRFVFNMAKYGTGVWRTYPKIVKLDKQVRSEYYPGEPEKDKFENKKIIKFNDLCRESLNPKMVWFSPMALPGEVLSMDDWYFEKEYSLDKFKQEFADYTNVGTVQAAPKTDSVEPNKKNLPTVTVGFYENQVLDLYVIWVPETRTILYASPLPNDDGLLSVSTAPWTLRSDESIYGIGLWEIIRNDALMYDRLSNMTVDQITLSIYKMFFYKGTDILGDNGQINVAPGVGRQVTDPGAITFVDVPGPGADAYKGLQFLQDRKDTISGVTPQLSGKFSGNTLGQDIQAKESALERMKVPLDFIVDALQNEAYISLSWQKQILSTPEVYAFNEIEDLVGALQEAGLDEEQIKKYLQEIESPTENNQLVFSEEPDEAGNQRKFANVYRETQYGLEQDENGELIESKDSRFYRFGTDLPTGVLDWKGWIRVNPQSILAPSKELTRRTDLDMFNLVYPAIQTMLAQPMNIPSLLPPIKQIIQSNDKEVSDWIDEEHLMQLYQQASQPSEVQPEPPKLSISAKFETLDPDAQVQILEKYAGIKVEPSLFVDQRALPAQAKRKEGSASNFGPLVPRGNISRAKTLGGAVSESNQIE